MEERNSKSEWKSERNDEGWKDRGRVADQEAAGMDYPYLDKGADRKGKGPLLGTPWGKRAGWNGLLGAGWDRLSTLGKRELERVKIKRCSPEGVRLGKSLQKPRI